LLVTHAFCLKLLPPPALWYLVSWFDLVSSAAGDSFTSVRASALVAWIRLPLDLFHGATVHQSFIDVLLAPEYASVLI
jgi:hypothetical protein